MMGVGCSTELKFALEGLKEGEYFQSELLTKQQVSHDTYIFTFKLQSPNMTLGLPVGKHIKLKAFVKTPEVPNGENVIRKYTPISPPNMLGQFQLMIKIYRANVSQQFPEGGYMTQHLEQMKLGESILVAGPEGQFSYAGSGKAVMGKTEKQYKHIGLIGAGSGITPLYGIMDEASKELTDQTQISFLFCNKTKEDILLKTELDSFGKSEKFKVYHALSQVFEPNHYQGQVTEQMLRETMPAPSEDTLILYCGPPGFERAVRNLLMNIGHDVDNTYSF